MEFGGLIAMASVSLIDPTVQQYGRVVVGAGSLIEANVILGHPGPKEVNAGARDQDRYDSLAEFYCAIAQCPTVIGEGAIVRSGSVIYAGAVIGRAFDCGHNVTIREGTAIGDGVYVKNGAEIMKNVQIGDGCRIAGVIADEVVLGERVSSFGVLTHAYRDYISPALGRTVDAQAAAPLDAPLVEDDVIIGRGAVVIGRRTIHSGAVVGANAVITFDVPSGARVVGPLPSRK